MNDAPRPTLDSAYLMNSITSEHRFLRGEDLGCLWLARACRKASRLSDLIRHDAREELLLCRLLTSVAGSCPLLIQRATVSREI